MLLIGSGNGNLPIPVACAALVESLSEMFAADCSHASRRPASLRAVRIVEHDWKQAQAIGQAIQHLKASLPAAAGRARHRAQGVTGAGGKISDDIALSAVLVTAARRLERGTAAARRQTRSVILQAIPTRDGLRERCAQALAGLVPDVRGDLLALADAVGFGHRREPTAPPGHVRRPAFPSSVTSRACASPPSAIRRWSPSVSSS